MVKKWLSIVGIGEAGVSGISAIARLLIDQAEILVGGSRHLALISDDSRQRIVWRSPIGDSIKEILDRRESSVCVLASGDPMWYGIGTTLLRHIPIEEITIVPAPSTFSLCCARLGWSLSEIETLSLCGRRPALLKTYLYPGAQLLILSAGKETPIVVADLLVQGGFGASPIAVLERLGGAHERIVSGTASTWHETDLADLNTIAVECVADSGVRVFSRVPGLPDDAYHHDGQLTKREVRSVTLSALAPTPGALLWDVGAGCGSIAIEWMRTDPRCRAIAIEKSRTHYIIDNANALGTPNLEIIEGKAPEVLQGLPQPDAIFIGGGATIEGLIETCWIALKSGGRLVANGVTIEGERILWDWHDRVGGELTRIEVQRVGSIGRFSSWKPMIPVTQWMVVKP